jgi:hypothetical protein
MAGAITNCAAISTTTPSTAVSAWFVGSLRTPTSTPGRTPAVVEEFFADLRGIKGRRQSTIRGYQNGLRLFCSYIADPDYGWDRVCEQRFGTHPAQVFFAWNTATHVQDNEQGQHISAALGGNPRIGPRCRHRDPEAADRHRCGSSAG